MTGALHLDVTIRSTADAAHRAVSLRPDENADKVTITYAIDDSKLVDPATFDGFVFGILLYAMKLGRTLRVHGPMSRSALYNLQELQSVWLRWRPDRYRRIDIEPDLIVDLERLKPGRRAIAAFSGGVDGTFTALRHAGRAAGAASFNLDTVLMVHGFDVALDRPDDFVRLVESTQPFLSSLGLQRRIVRTNSKELRLQDWRDSFGNELAACLHLFAKEFEFGLIGSSEPYDKLFLPVGSSPITDGLLSGDSFGVVHDGAGYSRTEKIALLVPNLQAVAGLHVCWEGPEQYRNCGSCEKCVRTRLNFLAVGVSNPSCFTGNLDLDAVDNMPIAFPVLANELQSIVAYAEANGSEAAWLRRLKLRLRRYDREATRRRYREWIVCGMEALGIKGAVKFMLRSLKIIPARSRA